MQLHGARDARDWSERKVFFLLRNTYSKVWFCAELWASAANSRSALRGEVRLECVVRNSGSHERSLARRCPRKNDGGNLGTEAGG
jgi:hypothetical protein